MNLPSNNFRHSILLLPVLLILLGSITVSVESKSKQSSKCSFDSFEKSVARVYGLFGMENARFPETEKAMNAYCKSVKSSIKSGKKFADQCMEPDQKSLLKLQLTTIDKANKEYCSKKGPKRTSFIGWSKCGNAAKSQTVKCWKSFIGNVGKIAGLRKNGEDNEAVKKDQMNLLCCKYHQGLDCMKSAWQGQSNVCKEDAVKGFEEMGKKTSQDSVSLVCAQIPNDQRDKICAGLEDKLKNIPEIDDKNLPPTALKFLFAILA